ncbi:MAG: exonuclease SbcCD subunit D [Bacteroidales bacterium]|nr:exonuclease SbcCD subunit D [Bacteroidales bacterium]
MKLMHLSDLHLGKRVNEFSMLEDQAFILDQLVDLAASGRPDAVVIAGDVYDKAVPPAEAVQLMDDFLCRLAALPVPVLIVGGNHDSTERLSFASRLLAPSGVHLAPPYDGHALSVVLHDSHGPVHFFLLPFVKPVHVRQAFPDEEIATYTDALRVAISHMEIDPQQRNVLVAHQFVTGATAAGSEELSVGGLDNVDVEVFESFDYVALGHIHGPQHVGRDTVRYCGSPLKYSFAEAAQHKSVTFVTLGPKGQVDIDTRRLQPLRDMREIRDTFAHIAALRLRDDEPRDDYMHITLTDEEDVVDALAQLRLVFPNILRLDYDNQRTRALAEPIAAVERRQPLDLFEELYQRQNGQPLSDEQRQWAAEAIAKIWEECVNV